MIILDTDVISLLDIQSGEAYVTLARRLGALDVRNVCVTIVSFEEQMRGWLSYIAASRTSARQVEGYLRLHAMLRWYTEQKILEFDARAASTFDRLKRSRIRVGAMDLKIAAIALANDALLVSRNTRDFRMVPDLRVEDWTR